MFAFVVGCAVGASSPYLLHRVRGMLLREEISEQLRREALRSDAMAEHEAAIIKERVMTEERRCYFEEHATDRVKEALDQLALNVAGEYRHQSLTDFEAKTAVFDAIARDRNLKRVEQNRLMELFRKTFLSNGGPNDEQVTEEPADSNDDENEND